MKLEVLFVGQVSKGRPGLVCLSGGDFFEFWQSRLWQRGDEGGGLSGCLLNASSLKVREAGDRHDRHL